MEIYTQLTSAGLLVSIKGALDGLSEDRVKRQLTSVLQMDRKYLLLDFSGVTEVTPAGLRNLLPYVQQVQQLKKELILFNLEGNIHGLINSSGFDSLVKVVDSLDTAIKYAKGRDSGGYNK
ncbi:STAS domain-containing protein [Rufibacter sp. XAAS-G3-1]|uniref:STAS domain-containing protein n=1 Tax=Rufibacter sp. XAAS-G3-1 TaxID=2729134 RepID=UPI0015E7C6BF|nr:STAS domain-containing protein [Rufibacter sp. XAAS-G3-1]